MKAVWAKLKGKKRYIAIAGAILTALALYLAGSITLQEFIQAALSAVGAA